MINVPASPHVRRDWGQCIPASAPAQARSTYRARRAGGDDRRPFLTRLAVIEKAREMLRNRLRQLSLDQLRDIIAEYGMDPDKLAMKWKSTERLVDRIVEVARGRSTKGDAFRS
jgi:hypothetical protein